MHEVAWWNSATEVTLSIFYISSTTKGTTFSKPETIKEILALTISKHQCSVHYTQT